MSRLADCTGLDGTLGDGVSFVAGQSEELLEAQGTAVVSWSWLTDAPGPRSLCCAELLVTAASTRGSLLELLACGPEELLVVQGTSAVPLNWREAGPGPCPSLGVAGS